MASPPDVYRPISCDFHDILEAVATTREPVSLIFFDDRGSLQSCKASSLDVLSRGGAEFMITSTGETLRLDRLVSVDHVKRDDF